MAKRFSTLQKEAEEKGYTLQQKGERYYASWEGINLDDDDRERLVDDMDAVIECSKDDSPYTLEEEPNERGEAIVKFEEQEFADISIAAALSKAKEAKLAKEKPSGGKRSFSRGNKPPEEIRGAGQEEEDKPVYKPGMDLKKIEPWQDPAPTPPNGGAGETTSDRKLFFDAIDELTNKMVEIRDRLATLLETAPTAPTESKRPRISRSK